MPVRYDIGEIRKPFRTSDGMLLAEATFARDGVLEYRRADGTTRRELRLPETNQDSATLHSFGLAPLGVEHPSGLINEDNAPDYRKGISLQNVKYVGGGKGGFVKGEVALFDAEAIRLAESGDKTELSAGYTCDVEDTPGVWRGQHYDAVQRNVRVNHIALTSRGRAGPDVRMHMDSLEDQDFAYQVSRADSDHPEINPETVSPNPSQPKKRMATFHLDSVEYPDIPEVFATAVAPKIKQLESLVPKYDSQTEKLSQTEEELQEITDERDRVQGRADAFELCLTNAETILQEMGYRRDGNGDYIRVDGGKKKPPMAEADDEEEDMADGGDDEEEEGEGDEMPPFIAKKIKASKSKAKSAKKDSQSDRQDAIVDPKKAAKALALAWREADQMVRSDSEEIFSEEHFDEADTPEEVRRLVVTALHPNLATKLDSASDGYVQGLYDSLKEKFSSEGDKRDDDDDFRSDAADDLLSAIGAARTTGAANRSSQAMNENAKRRMEAHKTPLTLSK